MHKDFIHKINQIILKNLSDEKFGVRELANEIGLSRSQLLRNIKLSTGKSINQLIREIRLNESLNLLKKENYTASEVSFMVGFNSPSYFSKCFHDYYGFPPGELKTQININEELIIVPKRKLLIRKLWKITTVIISLIVVLGVFLIYQHQNKNPISIGILPFKDFSENNNKEYLSDGFTEALTLELAKKSNLRIPSRTSSMPYKNSSKSCIEIAKEMRVDLILEGSCQIVDGKISVVAQLIDPFPKEKHLWENRYTLKFENILQLVENIASDIANEIDTEVLNIKSIKVSKVNPAAYNNYLKGRHLYNQQSSKAVIASIDYLKKSIEIDSTFALAYSTLAEAYITWNELRIDSEKKPENRIKGRDAINKALKLNNNSSEILIANGRTLGKFDWDWEGMKLMAEKGLKLDPSNSMGYMLLSEYYAIKNDNTNALKQAYIAVELDPLNPMIGCFLGEQLYIDKQYKKAIKQYKKVIELFPNYGFARDGIGYVYFETDQKEKAIQSWQKLMLIMNNQIMADLYQKESIDEALKYWLVKAKSSSPQYCSNPAIIAQAHLFIGEEENALKQLEIAYENHDEELPLKLIQPHFSCLRKNKRFQKIAENVGVVLD